MTTPTQDQLSQDLSEYKQLLDFLQSPPNTQTQVLAPIDGEGREYWVNAIADPTGEIELEIDGKVKTYKQKEAIDVISKKIKQLEKELRK